MRIDYDLLKKELKKPDSKTKFAFDESITLASFLSLISNIIYGAEQMKINELAMFISSLNHWVTNKANQSNREYKVGDIIEFECGLNYFGELSYRHTGIILAVSDTFVMVIPSTSGENYIKRTCEKKNGYWYYFLVDKKYGFEHECVLLLNNMKIVSKQRILSKLKNVSEVSADGKDMISYIKHELIKHYFGKQYYEYQKKIEELEQQITETEKAKETINEENSKLIKENSELIKKNKENKEKIKTLYKKNAFLAKRCK